MLGLIGSVAPYVVAILTCLEVCRFVIISMKSSGIDSLLKEALIPSSGIES